MNYIIKFNTLDNPFTGKKIESKHIMLHFWRFTIIVVYSK